MLADRGAFTTADYMVLVLVLVISAMIGAFFAYKGRKSTCNKEFLVGNRKLQVSIPSVYSTNLVSKVSPGPAVKIT